MGSQLEVTKDQSPTAYHPQTSALVLDPENLKSMMQFAEFMAKGVSTLPEHLRGKPSDCLAIVMQAMQWGMAPHIIAQKTHVTPSGVLGYEAQLISAVATSCGALLGEPDYEFFGDWTKIQGKVKEMVPEQKEGQRAKGKWYAADWKKEAETGLGVIVRATLRGETKPRELTLLLVQCYPRFSTQWATDPQQQICYAAIRKFCRRYAPGAILGVYTREELEGEDDSMQSEPRVIKPKADDLLPEYPRSRFESKLDVWKLSIERGSSTPEQVVDTITSKFTVPQTYIDEIMAFKPLFGTKAQAASEQTTTQESQA